MSLMKWLRRLAWALLALVIAAVAVRPVRKALEVVVLEATGQIQDFSWSEMRRFLHRGSGMNADLMLETKDPYSSLFAPPATPERVQAGRGLFNEQCAACHGQDATGGMAPNLTKGEFSHRASDWGLYRTITHGIPGTPMQARKSQRRQLRTWWMVSSELLS